MSLLGAKSKRAAEQGDSQKMQRVHSAQVYTHALKSFHNAISVPESVDVTLGSGPESSAYLVAEEGTPEMNDRDLRTTLRRKLRVDVIEGSNGVCQHARSDRTVCGVVHGHDGGKHAVKCITGGGVAQRHNDVRDALGEWLASNGKCPKFEQEVPRWNTVNERARLDIALTDQRLGEVCVDVSVVATETSGAGRGVLRSIERRENRKHTRYPGRGLVPFVVDVRGKWGKEAHAFVQAMVGSLPKDKRAEAIRICRRCIAVALQTGIANQIHSAGKPAALSEDVLYLPGPPLEGIPEDAVMASVEAERLSAQGRATSAAGG